MDERLEVFFTAEDAESTQEQIFWRAKTVSLRMEAAVQSHDKQAQAVEGIFEKSDPSWTTGTGRTDFPFHSG